MKALKPFLLPIFAAIWTSACSVGEVPELHDQKPELPQEIDHDCATILETQFVFLVNALRSQLGAAEVACRSNLSRLAQGHSDYFKKNPQFGVSHEQVYGAPGFSGATLDERGRHFGVDRAGYWLNEGVGGGADPQEVFARHIESVYHRAHLLSPGTRYVAFAEDVINSLILREPESTKALVYPFPGQSNVGLKFYPETEDPNPWPGRTETGVAISIHFPRSWLARNEHVEVNSFELAKKGEVLTGRLIQSQYDETVEPGDLFFLPAEAFLSGTEYVVNADLTYRGADFQYTWSFTTATD